MITDKVKILKALVALSLSTASKEAKTDMLRSINFSFKNNIKKDYDITVTMIQEALHYDFDSDAETECCSYLEFKSDDISVVVAIQGNWSSYDGYVYNDWYFCRSQPVTKLEYFRE